MKSFMSSNMGSFWRQKTSLLKLSQMWVTITFLKNIFFLILLWVLCQKKKSKRCFEVRKDDRRVIDLDWKCSGIIKTIYMKSFMSSNMGSFWRQKSSLLKESQMWVTITFFKNMFFLILLWVLCQKRESLRCFEVRKDYRRVTDL